MIAAAYQTEAEADNEPETPMPAAVAEGRLLGLVSEPLKKVRAPLNVRLWNGTLIRTVEHPNGRDTIDALVVSLSNPAPSGGGNPMGVDNIVLVK